MKFPQSLKHTLIASAAIFLSSACFADDTWIDSNYGVGGFQVSFNETLHDDLENYFRVCTKEFTLTPGQVEISPVQDIARGCANDRAYENLVELGDVQESTGLQKIIATVRLATPSPIDRIPDALPVWESDTITTPNIGVLVVNFVKELIDSAEFPTEAERFLPFLEIVEAQLNTNCNYNIKAWMQIRTLRMTDVSLGWATPEDGARQRMTLKLNDGEPLGVLNLEHGFSCANNNLQQLMNNNIQAILPDGAFLVSLVDARVTWDFDFTLGEDRIQSASSTRVTMDSMVVGFGTDDDEAALDFILAATGQDLDSVEEQIEEAFGSAGEQVSKLSAGLFERAIEGINAPRGAVPRSISGDRGRMTIEFGYPQGCYWTPKYGYKCEIRKAQPDFTCLACNW